MNELTNRYWPAVKYLLVPYLFLLFLLFYPIPYEIAAPGGLTEVDHLVEIQTVEQKKLSGSFSTTYVISIPRMTFFQFIIGTFSPYTDINKLQGPNLNYTNTEIIQIAYCDKATSVHAAIIVAYQAAQIDNPSVQFGLDERVLVFGKTAGMTNYDQVGLCDDFVSMQGDQGVVTNYLEVGANTTSGQTYTFTFRNSSGTEYFVDITKNAETNRFGLTFNRVYFVNKDQTFPTFTEVPNLVGGPSGGLLQAMHIYAQLIEGDLTKGLKIAGTGTISYNGNVGYIGGVKQKIITAYYNNVDLFFIPFLDANYIYDNYLEALRVCEEFGIDPTGWLIPVATFQDAIDYLESLGGQS
jgi:Lon-like protease